jgi:hypothetical protein
MQSVIYFSPLMIRKYKNINFSNQQVRIIFFIVLIFGFETGLFSQSTEYTMKAVALEKIALFISWPGNTLKEGAAQEFVIGVLGNNPFGDILENVFKDKKIKDRKVKIIYVTKIQELTGCQLLFIPKIKTTELKKVLDNLKGKPVLTISDTEGFAEAGCFINFYEFENKLRFEINQKGLVNAGFTIDYRLLKVSKVLNPVIE